MNIKQSIVKKLSLMATLLVVLLPSLALASTAAAYAASPAPAAPVAPAAPDATVASPTSPCGDTTDTSPKGLVLQGATSTGSDCSGAGVNSVIKAVVNILSTVVGIAAVIMVILAGFKYVTSAGDSGKVSSAKNTLVYALVGLAVAAVALVLPLILPLRPSPQCPLRSTNPT
jgi:uncharacterized membrane protein YuzA (DUF378 family)